MTMFITGSKIFPSTFSSVFAVLNLYANHKNEDKAVDAYVAFAESNRKNYVFENELGETYKLTRIANVFSLGFSENDFSGNPEVVEKANIAFISLK